MGRPLKGRIAESIAEQRRISNKHFVSDAERQNAPFSRRTRDSHEDSIFDIDPQPVIAMSEPISYGQQAPLICKKLRTAKVLRQGKTGKHLGRINSFLVFQSDNLAS